MSEERVCANPDCGVVLVRREGEAVDNWNRRKTCGGSCASAVMWIERRRRKPVVYDEVTCVVCQAVIPPRNTDPPSVHRLRRTCSEACNRKIPSIFNSIIAKPNPCLVCGQLFSPREGENVKNWRKRKTCSNECFRQRISQSRSLDRLPPKLCAVCGGDMVHREREPASHYQKRKTCSPKCHKEFILRRPGLVDGMREGAKLAALRRRENEPARVCVACGEPFLLQPGEPVDKFRRRQKCSKNCRSQYIPMSKSCRICGVIFSSRDGETRHQFRKRSTCSDSCSAKLIHRHAVRIGTARRVHLDPKWCKICGVQFERQPDANPVVFRRRETCSRACAHKLAAQRRITNTARKGPYNAEFSQNLKERIRERDGYRCRLCGQFGGRRKLAVHHIDYVKANCDDGNLVALCTSCHSKTNGDRGYWTAFFRAMLDQKPAA